MSSQLDSIIPDTLLGAVTGGGDVKAPLSGDVNQAGWLSGNVNVGPMGTANITNNYAEPPPRTGGTGLRMVDYAKTPEGTREMLRGQRPLRRLAP